MTVHVRRASVEDSEALASLMRLTWREMSLEDFAIPYPLEDIALFETRTSAPDVVVEKLRDIEQATWVADDNGALLGFADVGPCSLPHPDADPSQMELHRLYVRRTARGVGLGGQLMNSALRWMERRTSGPLWVGVWSGNLRAQAFYARRGFQKVGEYDFPVGTWLDRDFIMRRR